MAYFLLILKSYWNWFISKLFRRMPEKAMTRWEICKSCNANKNGWCMHCGCWLRAKVQAPYIEDLDGKTIDGCPEKKW